METEEQEQAPAADEAGGEQGLVGGPADAGEEISGLIRRVRRLVKVSQRELAHDLGVSQSAVAKWETARTSALARAATIRVGPRARGQTWVPSQA